MITTGPVVSDSGVRYGLVAPPPKKKKPVPVRENQRTSVRVRVSAAALALTAAVIGTLVAFPASARYVDGRDDVPSIDQDLCSLIQLGFDLAEDQAELDARHGNWSWFWRAVDEMRGYMEEWQRNGCDEYYGPIHNFRRVFGPDDLIDYWNDHWQEVEAELAQEMEAVEEDPPESSGDSGSGPIVGPSPGPAPSTGPAAGSSVAGSSAPSSNDCRLCVD